MSSENKSDENKSEVSAAAPVIEVIEREEANVKKCGNCLSKDARCLFHCCIKTWSFTLNGCECCCAGLSACCIFSSAVAMGCNKCMESIDCDEK